MAFADTLREDAPALIQAVRNLGVRVLMISGDTVATARAIARQVGLGDRFHDGVAQAQDPLGFDGFAHCYPQEKFQLVQRLQQAGHVVGMTGDGVNDAPALKQAEVGIAVSSATDVAKASAQVVLTKPGLKDMIAVINSGRRVYRRMLTWTITKIARTIELAVLLTFGYMVTGFFVTSLALIAIRSGQRNAVILEHVEHCRIAGGDAIDALRQKVCAQLVGNGLAHQPECILSQPPIRGLGLVQLEFLAQEETQAIEQLALQGVLGRGQRLAGIAAEFLGHRGLVGLHHQFAEHAGVLVLAGQHVQKRGPEVGVAGEPVEDARIEQPSVEQPGGGTVQPVLAFLAVAEAVGPFPLVPFPCPFSALSSDITLLLRPRTYQCGIKPHLFVSRRLLYWGIGDGIPPP